MLEFRKLWKLGLKFRNPGLSTREGFLVTEGGRGSGFCRDEGGRGKERSDVIVEA